MKNRGLSTLLTFFVMILLFMTSCSTIMNHEFSKQRYTKFKKGNGERTNLTKVKDFQTSKITQPENTIISSFTPIEIKSEVIITQNKDVFNGSLFHELSQDQEHSKSSLKKLFTKRETTPKYVGVNHKDEGNDFLIVILCILLPWAAVLIRKGVGTQFWISLILWLCFWIPGIIYAFIVCF